MNEITFPLDADDVAQVVAERDAEIDRLRAELADALAGQKQLLRLNGEIIRERDRARRDLRAAPRDQKGVNERLMAAIKGALKNGWEGMWSASWDQDNAVSGFWIPYEDYRRLVAALAGREGR